MKALRTPGALFVRGGAALIYSSGATGTMTVGLRSDAFASGAAGFASGAAAPVEPVMDTSPAVADLLPTGAGIDLPGVLLGSGMTTAVPDAAGGVTAALL